MTHPCFFIGNKRSTEVKKNTTDYDNIAHKNRYRDRAEEGEYILKKIVIFAVRMAAESAAERNIPNHKPYPEP